MPRTRTEQTPDARLEDASLRLYRLEDPLNPGTFVNRVGVTLILTRSDGSSGTDLWDVPISAVTSLTGAQKTQLRNAVLALLGEARTALSLTPP